ncbi:MAG: hypothetical protein VB144_11375 [Clostridia bacterium]|nr:hypothetical protein [Clostridia bacterium]
MDLSKRDLAQAMAAVRKALACPEADDEAARWLPGRCRIAVVSPLLDGTWSNMDVDVVDDQPVIGLAPGLYGEPKDISLARRYYRDGSTLAYANVWVSPTGELRAAVADCRGARQHREYTGEGAYEVLVALVRDDIRSLVELAQPTPPPYKSISITPAALPANTDEGFQATARGNGDVLEITAERVCRDSELKRAPGWRGYMVSPRVYGPFSPPYLAELIAKRCGWDCIDPPFGRHGVAPLAVAEQWLLQHPERVLDLFGAR